MCGRLLKCISNGGKSVYNNAPDEQPSSVPLDKIVSLLSDWKREKQEHEDWSKNANENELEQTTHKLCAVYVGNHIDQLERIIKQS